MVLRRVALAVVLLFAGGCAARKPRAVQISTYQDVVALWNVNGPCQGHLRSDGQCVPEVQWGSIYGDIKTQTDLQAQFNTKAPVYPRLTLQSGIAYTLSWVDNSSIITFNSSNPVTVTIPPGLTVGFSCLLIQGSDGQISIVGNAVTINQRQKLFKTAGRYAVASVISYVPDSYILSGDLQ